MRRQRHRIRPAIHARKERIEEEREHGTLQPLHQEQHVSLTSRMVDTVEQAAEALPDMIRTGVSRLRDEVVELAHAAEDLAADVTGKQTTK